MQNRIANQGHFLIFQEPIALEGALKALIVDELEIGIVAQAIGDGVGQCAAAESLQSGVRIGGLVDERLKRVSQ